MISGDSVRILLIDNYDSFTYNLFQLLAEVNGSEPRSSSQRRPAVALRASWRTSTPSSSRPVPAAPNARATSGSARRSLARGELPMLGVCLGHQGIAAPARRRGSERAPEPLPRPGLAGAPRRHRPLRRPALAVPGGPLPLAGVGRMSPLLEPTAWTPDGLLMGLRHRDLPLWGVQFHPESIGGPSTAPAARQLPGPGPGAPPAAAAATCARPGRAGPAPATGYRRAGNCGCSPAPLATRWDDEMRLRPAVPGRTARLLAGQQPPATRSGPVLVHGRRLAARWRSPSPTTARSTRHRQLAHRQRDRHTGPFLDWLDRDLATCGPNCRQLPVRLRRRLGRLPRLRAEGRVRRGGHPALAAARRDAGLRRPARRLRPRARPGTLLALADAPARTAQADGLARAWPRRLRAAATAAGCTGQPAAGARHARASPRPRGLPGTDRRLPGRRSPPARPTRSA